MSPREAHAGVGVHMFLKRYHGFVQVANAAGAQLDVGTNFISDSSGSQKVCHFKRHARS